MAFSELILASRVADREYLSRIGEKTLEKCAAHFYENRGLYASEELTQDDAQFLMEQAFNKSISAVGPVVQELVFGDQYAGKAQMASGIMTICFPERDISEVTDGLQRVILAYATAADAVMSMADEVAANDKG